MKCCMKIGKNTFVSNKSHKDAYLKAVKWYYGRIFTCKHSNNVSVEFHIKENEEYPTVEAIVYVMLDEMDIKNNNCSVCKETHSLFYFNYETSCQSCNMEAYRKRAEDKLKVKAMYLKELLGGS